MGRLVEIGKQGTMFAAQKGKKAKAGAHKPHETEVAKERRSGLSRRQKICPNGDERKKGIPGQEFRERDLRKKGNLGFEREIWPPPAKSE